MAMSNYIDESERHSELYGMFTERQSFLLSLIAIAKHDRNNNEAVQQLLFENSVTDSEIGWLKRTGHYLPVYK